MHLWCHGSLDRRPLVLVDGRVGRCARLLASHRKSFRVSCTCRVVRIRPLMGCQSAFWMWLKRPHAPGSASVIDRSSPSRPCHLRMDTRFCVLGISARSSDKRSRRCWGSSSVLAIVSMSQPRMIFRVLQAPSPFFSFFMEAGSCRYGVSLGSRGRRTRSKVSNSTRRIRRRRLGPPCAAPQKSSTYTSNFPSGRRCPDIWSWWLGTGSCCSGVMVIH